MTNNSALPGEITLGDLTVPQFLQASGAAAAKVLAVPPTTTPLSEADLELLVLMSAGGALQLGLSKAALPRLSSEAVVTLAKAELDEQMSLSTKLQKLVHRKRAALPVELPPEARAMQQEMESLAGAALDAYYVRTSGVEGHRKLEETMSTVAATATDATLRGIAEAALPLIRLHGETAQALLGQLGAGV